MLEKEVKRDIQRRQPEENGQGNVFEHHKSGTKSQTGRRNALPFHISGYILSLYHAAMIAGARVYA